MPDQENPPQGPPAPPPGPQMPLGGEGDQNLIPINIEDEMRRSYLDYAMSVIVGRALPDVRDGLKPVHRRILYGMHEMGLHVQPAHSQVRQDRRRSAGQVPSARRRAGLRRAGAHGAGLFACAIRWSTGRETSARWMAIRPRPCGTPKRGCRASPPRCSKISTRKPSISGPTTTKASMEPEVLPTRVPEPADQRIVGHRGGHGHQHSAAQSDRNHQRHHSRWCRIRKRTLAKIVEMVQGPDFPTGGFILGRQGILDYFTKGRGTLKTARQGRHREAAARIAKHIVVTEIPYQVNKARLIEHAAALVNEKKIEGISEIRDESDRDGMRIVFELKRGEQAEVDPQQSLQAHPAADQLRRDHAVHRQRAAARAGPDRRAQALHRSSHRCGAPPHRLPAAQGARARAPPARLQEGARKSGRGDQADPRVAATPKEARDGADRAASSSPSGRRRPSSNCSCSA